MGLGLDGGENDLIRAKVDAEAVADILAPGVRPLHRSSASITELPSLTLK